MSLRFFQVTLFFERYSAHFNIFLLIMWLSLFFSSEIKQQKLHYKTNDQTTSPIAFTSVKFFFPFCRHKTFEANHSLKVAECLFGSRKTVITNISCSLMSQETRKENTECLGATFFVFLILAFKMWSRFPMA